MTTSRRRSPDITINDQVTLVLLTPASRRARAWFTAHVDQNGQRWGAAYVIEPRYVQDILAGATADGLTAAAA